MPSLPFVLERAMDRTVSLAAAAAAPSSGGGSSSARRKRAKGGKKAAAAAAAAQGGAAAERPSEWPCLRHGSFLVDPRGDLPQTRKRLGPLLEGLTADYGWAAVATPGEPPPEGAFGEALQKSDVVLYSRRLTSCRTCAH